MYGYIYKTTNLINGKIYIGKKVSNIFLDVNYLGSGKYIRRAINKYGTENFLVEMLETCDSNSNLNKAEKFWIKHFRETYSNNMYNIADGGEGGNIYSTLSADDKINAVNKMLKTRGKRVYITDGINNKHVPLDDINLWLDAGWKKGVTRSEDSKIKQKQVGAKLSTYVFYTNGEKNTRIDPNNAEKIAEIIALGFYQGHTKTKKAIEARSKKSLAYKQQREAKINTWLSEIHHCEHCGKVLTEYTKSGRFCSRSCSSTHKHSEETKNKIRSLNLEGKCGRKGKLTSDDVRKKQSESALNYHKKNKFIWINKDNKDKRIEPMVLQKYLADGWKAGRVKGRQVAWNKGLSMDDPRVLKNIENRTNTMIKLYNTLDISKIKKMKEQRGDQ